MALHEVTLDDRYLQRSKELMSYTMEHFYDEQSDMFFYTSDEDKNLIARKVEVIDGVIPSNAITANNLFKLGHYLYDTKMTNMAEQMLNNLSKDVYANSLSFANWLHLMTNFSNPFYEVAVVGENAVSEKQRFASILFAEYHIIAATQDSNQPLLANKYGS